MPLSPQISACFSRINNLRGYLEVGENTVHKSNRMVYEIFSPILHREFF